ATAYLVLMLITTPPEGAGGHSLQAVIRLFESPQLALVCWIHYLAFDLFVGAWEVRDAARRGIPHLAVVPCVLLTLLVGPAGLLLYLIIRAVVRKTFTLDEAAGPMASWV
ncbi:MAG TPA: ABA4-like family protein, partial [Candidatus Nanopelagicales bacterium]|nr:ABA4-like family protein [Candidatus Nanopelagicales bacterium]